ncbi:MAG: S1/P1 nuclease [Bacteriovoracaceae bacterium]
MKYFLFSFFISSQVFAWGPTGHRVVGELAQIFLEPKALTEVRAILDGRSLSRISTWPDEIRSQPEKYSYTFKWHYTDWPNEMKEHDESKSSGSLVSSIREQLSTLKNKKAPLEKRSFALKFLVHLVGDLHMPLHVGNGKDAGGNKCFLKFMGERTNFHALWDEGIINFSKLSYTELTDYLIKEFKPNQRAEWIKGDILDWAAESRKMREEIYPKEMVCGTETNLVSLSYDYSNLHMLIIEQRLFQAGIRLAFLINQALK